MENASKALIIVGAVLIAILLIGFGVMIMNSSTSQVDTSVLDSQAAQAHNSNFTNYIGDRKKASEIKTLMNHVISNNVTGQTADTPQKVFVRYAPLNNGTEGNLAFVDPSAVISAVRNGYTYTVSVDNQQAENIDNVTGLDQIDPGNNNCYYSNGYIRILTIRENVRQ